MHALALTLLFATAVATNEILELERTWNNAHLAGNADALEVLWADYIVIVVPGMEQMSKASALRMWRTTPMKFSKYETSDTQTRVNGDTAVVTGRLQRARDLNGRIASDDWRFTKVYARQDGTWRVVSFHALENPTHPADALFIALQPLCGRAFLGRVVEGTEPTDASFREQRLVMHVRQCSPNEIRIPFHVGENRSRTWVITRTPTGARLKHDHRHEDGSEDRITQYGGDTRTIANPTSLDFFADEHTATLIPAAATNIWTVAIDPGKTFAYALRREAQGRRFRVEFDLAKPVAAPPAPW